MRGKAFNVGTTGFTVNDNARAGTSLYADEARLGAHNSRHSFISSHKGLGIGDDGLGILLIHYKMPSAFG